MNFVCMVFELGDKMLTLSSMVPNSAMQPSSSMLGTVDNTDQYIASSMLGRVDNTCHYIYVATWWEQWTILASLYLAPCW